MNVIFTCGGTAGHVNPALALAGYMQKQDPQVQVLFVGTPDGMERDLVERPATPSGASPWEASSAPWATAAWPTTCAPCPC